MITIRLATIDDAAECLAIYTPYVEGTAISFEYAVPSIDDFRSRMDKTLTEYPYLVAVKEGKVLGYAYAGPFHTRAAFKHAAEVSIYIDRNHRGLGIGKRLYAALEQILQMQHVFTACACIATTDLADDPYLTGDSVRFHEAMDYHRVGEHLRCGFKFGRWYHVIWMEKELGQRPENPEPFIPFFALDTK